MSNVYVRTLVFASTEHVVWASIDPNPNFLQAKRVPTLCHELDYRAYMGPLPKNFWEELKNYKLTKGIWSLTAFGYKDLPDEFFDTVRLMRAKCYAAASIHTTTRFYKEKHGLVENPLMTPDLDRETVISIFQHSCNLSREEADKFSTFKLEELKSIEKNVFSLQLETELRLTEASSVEQVVDIYQTMQKSLGMVNAYDITKML